MRGKNSEILNERQSYLVILKLHCLMLTEGNPIYYAVFIVTVFILVSHNVYIQAVSLALQVS